MVARVYHDRCDICGAFVETDTRDRLREHRREEHAGAVDADHLEAMREVDALTPECPPIAPPLSLREMMKRGLIRPPDAHAMNCTCHECSGRHAGGAGGGGTGFVIALPSRRT